MGAGGSERAYWGDPRSLPVRALPAEGPRVGAGVKDPTQAHATEIYQRQNQIPSSPTVCICFQLRRLSRTLGRTGPLPLPALTLTHPCSHPWKQATLSGWGGRGANVTHRGRGHTPYHSVPALYPVGGARRPLNSQGPPSTAAPHLVGGSILPRRAPSLPPQFQVRTEAPVLQARAGGPERAPVLTAAQPPPPHPLPGLRAATVGRGLGKGRARTKRLLLSCRRSIGRTAI